MNILLFCVALGCGEYEYLIDNADMRKGAAVWPLAAEICMDCGNVMVAANSFLIILNIYIQKSG